MIVNQLALKRQITVIVLTFLVLVTGTYSFFSLPREDEPDITIPYIFVTTLYEGVAPEDMEKLITIPLERKLKGIADTEEITSTSRDGESTIAIEFLPSVDIDDAMQKVRDKVDQAQSDLPEDLEDDPFLTEVNFSEMPVVNIVFSGPFSLKLLKSYAKDFQDRIEGIPGVLDAEMIGGLEREIHVEFDMDRLSSYRIPASTIISALEQGNVNMPGGSMDIGRAKYLVRTPEDFQHPSEINNLVVFVKDGQPIYIRDIARIRDHYKRPETISRINGHNSVTLAVSKRSGENIIRVVEDVRDAVVDTRTAMPPALQVDYINNEAEDVELMVLDLENNILTGLFLVLCVVFVFIGGRSAVFVALAIPLSMLISFTLLHALDITLNMVVLFSLTLALGMLVDNGIVIVENIYRHMQENKDRYTAAVEGTNEVAWPVTTSTLTTLGAFVPILFWPGIMGEFMKYLPITVIITLSASLFVALVVNPVLSARYQTVKQPAPSSREKPPLIKRVYKRLLLWALRFRLLVLFIVFLAWISCFFGFLFFGQGVEFFPDVEPRSAEVLIKAPVGTNLKTSNRLVQKAEAILAEYPDIKNIISSVGKGTREETGEHMSSLSLEFFDFSKRPRPSSEAIVDIRERLNQEIREAEVRVQKPEQGPPTGPAVNLEIQGEDIAILGQLANRAKKLMQVTPGLVNIKDTYIVGKPEIRVRVDKEKAALQGISAYEVASMVKTAINGMKVGVYREGKEEYDIVALLPEEDRNSIEDLKELTVAGPGGDPVPLTSLARIIVGSGYGDISHIDQKRIVTVSADNSGRLANDIIVDLKRELQGWTWPRNYEWEFTGEQEEQEKSQAFLTKGFIAALLIVFLILVTQFNSAVTPFIILTSVLLSLMGVFLGLLITAMPLGVIMTGVGIISLAGVVVNNAIVLIDYFQQLKARGMPSDEALVQAGMVRFRPVMLTAITTILGLMPMATGISFNFVELHLAIGSESSQWWGSMAIAVIFGLAVATLLTLIVVPVLCSLQDSLKQRFRGAS